MISLLLACGEPKDSDSGTDPVDSETGSTVPSACPEGTTATFTGEDGSVSDLTDALLAGTWTTLDQPGTLSVCPGTWFARLLVRADVTVEGLGASPEETVLSGGESGTILDVLGPDVTLTARNLTLDRGAGLDVDHNSGGGGIYCEGVDGEELTKVEGEDLVFSNSYANDGAGFYSQWCDVEMKRASFVDNLSDDDGGSFTVWYGDAELEEVRFSGNQALDGGAFAIFYGEAEFDDVWFEDNLSTHVAGAAWFYSSSLVMKGGGFVGNDNAAGEAGALLLYGEATLEGVSFSDNAGLHGGGLYVYYEGLIDAVDCSFSGNVADDVWVADYSEAGGVAYSVSGAASFSCSANTCTGL